MLSMQGTAAHVDRFLTGNAPDWQQEANASVQQQACVSCVDARDGDWAAPERYRRKFANVVRTVREG